MLISTTVLYYYTGSVQNQIRVFMYITNLSTADVKPCYWKYLLNHLSTILAFPIPANLLSKIAISHRLLHRLSSSSTAQNYYLPLQTFCVEYFQDRHPVLPVYITTGTA